MIRFLARGAVPPLRPVALLAACALCLASSLSAQDPARLGGIVFDSLVTNAPLADAEVFVEGTTLATKTDRNGRFLFEQVPAGSYTVTVDHPRLSEVGVSAAPVPVRLTPAADLFIDVVTPSPTRVFRARCGRMPSPEEGLLLGFTRLAGADSAVAGATVEATWVEYLLSLKTLKQDTTTKVARSVTDPRGVFQVCGVPRNGPFQVEVRSVAGGRAVSELDLLKRVVAFETFRVAAPAAPVQTAQGTAGLAGLVTDADGRPVPNTDILVAEVTRGRSNAEGRFAIGGLAPGKTLVQARAIGYTPIKVPAELVAGQTRSLTLRLVKPVQVLDSLLAKATGPSVRARAQVEARRQQGLGTILSTEEVNRPPGLLIDRLALVPFLRTDTRTGQLFLQRFGDQCNPAIMLDGRVLLGEERAQPGDGIIDRMNTNLIETVEIYRAPQIPFEFQGASLAADRCGVIAIWRKVAMGTSP
ncbi:MAG: carboxypeptidase regulatory-like domain-containing protein [Gemmatimonadales bacterium]|nr:carboxypeptidase regulatory-like domain-containing protein [Gemmatimonadales bacterium]